MTTTNSITQYERHRLAALRANHAGCAAKGKDCDVCFAISLYLKMLDQRDVAKGLLSRIEFPDTMGR